MPVEEQKQATAVAAATPATSADKQKSGDQQQQQLSPQQKTIRLLRSHVYLLRKGVVQSDPRLVRRVLRDLTAVRRQLTLAVLRALATQYQPTLLPKLEQAKGSLMSDSAESDEEDLSPPTAAVAPTTDATQSKSSAAQAEKERKEAELMRADVPEVDMYIQMLVALFFLDKGLKEESAALMSDLFQAVNRHNRRSLDLLSAKIFSFYSLTHEIIGKEADIRNSLLLAHRTACLQHNEPGQASLSVCILRNYLNHHLYRQADTFRLKSSFPDQRSNAQTARYQYYTGKIHAVQLHYSDAFAALTQALRKAPQQAAVGFRQTCTKLLVLVQLLMGDIPDRSLFSPADMRRSLLPYLSLTQAVRVGDLSLFNESMRKHQEVFAQDGLDALILRLRSTVIKAGLRKINLAYSKISLADICAKLKLENAEDAEYMVVKAIHDGVIEARLDRQQGVLLSRETADVYSTQEPQQELHKRIQFTLDIQQQAIKSLRYPAASSRARQDWESSDDEDDEDTIAGNAPDKREEEKKKDA